MGFLCNDRPTSNARDCNGIRYTVKMTYFCTSNHKP